MLKGALAVIALSAGILVAQAQRPADLPAPPPLPYEEVGACPFECCTYRKWTVEANTVVRAERRDNSPIAFRLRRGESVDGLTGVVVTSKFGKAVVRQPTALGEAALPVKPGEVVYIINYVGEGYWKFWVGGSFGQQQIPERDQQCAGDDHQPIGDLRVANPTQCDIQITTEPETVWWAEVRNRAGRIGWTRDLEHFGDIDACG